MRYSRLLMTLVVFIASVFFGCGDQQMTKPIIDIIDPPEPTPMNYLQLAMEDMERVNQRRTEALMKAVETGDYTPMFLASETILNEELGFQKGFWVKLVEIYRDENATDPNVVEIFDTLQKQLTNTLNDETFEMNYFDHIRIFDPLIVEYLRLSYENPNLTEEDLLTQYQESVRTGNVSIEIPTNS
ncbi:hypothetical protein C6497_13990 [Candidatus Poribacteria bacterium]|nr:MAG: hypothetical protein C6497_13990 [Candidatus Poribacteria bacterium]